MKINNREKLSGSDPMKYLEPALRQKESMTVRMRIMQI